MTRIPLSLAFTLLASHAVAQVPSVPPVLAPHEPKWHMREFKVATGVTHHQEDVSPLNPFMDYRMNVHATPPSASVDHALGIHDGCHDVAGFFAGDGAGGPSGMVWKVRITPDEVGTWSAVLAFESGPSVNIDSLGPMGADGLPVSLSGVPVAPIHGRSFNFVALGLDPGAKGFKKYGLLEHTGEHYLKFADGPYFLKGGVDSPETLFAYEDFEDPVTTGRRLHHYASTYAGQRNHALTDWVAGDPEWTANGVANSGHGLIGAINYLASQGVNSVYFLPMNMGGDGSNTHPFVSTNKRTNFHVQRMEQWEVVMNHLEESGILLHLVLAEQESGNINYLGGNADLNDVRKGFLKNFVAMFGHHLAIKWNLCEENSDWPSGDPEFSPSQLNDIAAWIQEVDDLDHVMGVHCDPNDLDIFGQLQDEAWLTAPALQLNNWYGDQVEDTRDIFLAASTPRKVVVDQDEQGPWNIGATDSNHDDRRKEILWDVYLSGGNIEWYFGYHPMDENNPTVPFIGGDIETEDFSTRQELFEDTLIARQLLEQYPFWEMEPKDGLIQSAGSNDWGGPECFAKLGEVYILYFPKATSSPGVVSLNGSANQTMRGYWYNPRTGVIPSAPTTFTVPSNADIAIPAPPSSPNEDWVYVVDDSI